MRKTCENDISSSIDVTCYCKLLVVHNLAKRAETEAIAYEQICNNAHPKKCLFPCMLSVSFSSMIIWIPGWRKNI